MPLERRAVIRALPKKGFSKETKHHIYFYHRANGKETGFFTKVSHSGRQIPDTLVTQMRKQLKLETNSQLRDLIECPMSAKDYLKFLKKKGLLR